MSIWNAQYRLPLAVQILPINENEELIIGWVYNYGVLHKLHAINIQIETVG